MSPARLVSMVSRASMRMTCPMASSTEVESSSMGIWIMGWRSIRLSFMWKKLGLALEGAGAAAQAIVFDVETFAVHGESCQRSEIRDQRSGIRDQRSEIRDQRLVG